MSIEPEQERRPRIGPWKGLDPGVVPIFLGYEQVERMIVALLSRAAAWQPDLVVAIARGGLVPAAMAAALLAKPLAVIAHERASGVVTWQGAPPAGRRVLLVDDGCSTGSTMAAVRRALLREERACLTLAVVHDPERTAFIPDLSHPLRALWRFPWERGEATPEGRALRATGAGPDRGTEAPLAAVDLDGDVLPELLAVLAGVDARDAPPPFFHRERELLITSRSELDCSRIGILLRRHHITCPLARCADDSAGDRHALAIRKAVAATRYGCTHFIDGDPAEAILIAAAAPHLLVLWWQRREARVHVVGAAAGALSCRSDKDAF